MRRAAVPALVLLAAAALAEAARVSEQAVHDVASELRCVVCQNLSVADSPSEMAGQMRAIVRERLERGDSPAEVRQYFVERYGEWILLSPRPVGFNLLLWLFPSRYSGSAYLIASLGFYAVAKLLESADAPLFAMTGFVSGHTLKHLTAAMAGATLIAMLRGRANASLVDSHLEVLQ